MLAFCLSTAANAQDIVFADANFKSTLLMASSANSIAFNVLGNPIAVDTNADGEIQTSEVLNVYRLQLAGRDIQDLSGIEFFANLRVLGCQSNRIASLDVTDLNNLITLNCSENRLTTLHFEGLANLQDVNCSQNLLANDLVLTGLTQLHFLNCSNNFLVNLNITELTELYRLECMNNGIRALDFTNVHHAFEAYCESNSLNSILMNNGFVDTIHFPDNPGMNFMCTDAAELTDIQAKVADYGYTNCNVIACALDARNFTGRFTSHLYPNPAADILYIEPEAGIAITTASIYNVLGQLVLAIPDINVVSGINVSGLKAGNYFVRINSGNRVTQAQFVKK